MAFSQNLLTLAHCLAGTFNNQRQAFDNPTWFVHLKVWQYPVTVFGNNLGLFIEQISVAANQPPYRQRLIELREDADQIWMQYYGLKSPQTFCGAATEPERLAQLTHQDLIVLPDCQLWVKSGYLPSGEKTFTAEMRPGQLCSFEYQGKRSFVSLGFEIRHPAETNGKILLLSRDRGIEPTTGQVLWGPRMGPFELWKQDDFSSQYQIREH